MALPLALTLGEPAGIGPDITFAAWRRRAELGLTPFYILADPVFLRGCAERIAPDVPVAVVEPPAAITAIRRAVHDVHSGRARAVVTNPVAKTILYRSGFAEPGHTEYLAKLTAEMMGISAQPVMMLWSPELAVVPVTIHLPLREVMARLTTELISSTGEIVARDLKQRFGIARPRLAIAGLNPHAGEDGALGEEDGMVVAPAVARLRAQGIEARGPLPADTLFHAAA